MKSKLIIALLMLVTVTMGGCSNKPDEPETKEMVLEIDETAATELAHAFFDAYIAGDYESAYSYPFEKEMEAAFPVPAMKSTADQIEKKYGSFIEKQGEKTSYSQGYYIVTIGGIHEKKALAYNVVFNEESQIAGFHYREIDNLDDFFADESESVIPVTFGSEAFPLDGTLLYPEGDGPFPAVVLVHGSGPNDRDETAYDNKPFKDIAEGLASQGIAVLRYDKRTYTHAAKFQDKEIVQNMTAYDEVIDDARYAVDFLETQKDIEQIYILGHSLGGNQAPRIAEGRDDIAGLIIMGGYVTPLQNLMLYQYEYLYGLEVNSDEETKELYEKQISLAKDAVALINSDELKPDTDPNLTFGVAAPYWMDLRDYDPTAVAKELDIPLLILQGGRDYQVPPAEFELWQEKLGDKSKYKFYESLNHLFIAGEGTPSPEEYKIKGNVSDEVIDDIAAWVLASE